MSWATFMLSLDTPTQGAGWYVLLLYALAVGVYVGIQKLWRKKR